MRGKNFLPINFVPITGGRILIFRAVIKNSFVPAQISRISAFEVESFRVVQQDERRQVPRNLNALMKKIFVRRIVFDTEALKVNQVMNSFLDKHLRT